MEIFISDKVRCICAKYLNGKRLGIFQWSGDIHVLCWLYTNYVGKLRCIVLVGSVKIQNFLVVKLYGTIQ